ncbi:MAG TPA: serine/threonine-protein kinase [Sandaracinaceae bacterium LLY-WYZ-13_1]|nr:serine/threonine-protein kinase [Sandaracinaceae bacterium LLY-WYZ-13_1]
MQLGEYRLLERLGQGGMALVYRGERTAEAGFKKLVALKRMLPQYRRDPSLLERFAAEARTNARLDHPNLVAVVDFGIEPEPYLVMEFVEGMTLALLLQRLVEMGQRLEIAAACFIGAEAAQGLDHAHRKRDEHGNPLGIVHRDVSPQNVLLSNEGAVKVSDFGLVKAADNVVQTGSGVPIGKMSYMAPEQADHRQVDARADVFSLGIVVWECLTMRTLMPPNDPATASQMLQACNFPPPSTYRPDVPPELDAIVMGCLVKDESLRTPSAQAVGMQLREVLHEVAPGYGRDQLARLLGWAFPERGWSIDEPHETAAQPSVEERLSMPQIHAADAMQRASAAPPQPADPAPANQAPAHPPPGATRPDASPAAPEAAAPSPLATGQVPALAQPSKPRRGGSTLPWILLVGAVALAGIVVVVALVLLFVFARGSSQGTSPPPAPAMEPVQQSADVHGLTVTTDVPGARVFLGDRELGAAPVALSEPELNGQPLVAVAPGRQPAVIEPDRLAELVQGGPATESLRLLPHRRPDLAIFVRHPRPATARMAHTRRILGSVPGVILVPPANRLGRRPVLEIIEDDGETVRVATTSCDPATVCVLDGARADVAAPTGAP